MNVSAQLARNSGLRVRINRKVATTAADNNKQGDVQAMEFGNPGYDDLVWNVSLVCDRIGSSMQHGLNVKLQLGDYLNARARIKINRYRRDYEVGEILLGIAVMAQRRHGTAHASPSAAPRPAPPRPAVNVNIGAPSVAPSAHANRAGVSREVDVVDDGRHTAGGVAASGWLAANLGGGVVAAGGGTGARISANDDAQSDDDDDNSASVLEDILGRQMRQREDMVCNEDGTDVSVGVDGDAVVGVGVHGQGVNLGVSLRVGIVVGPPPYFTRLLGSLSEIWESYDLNYHLPS